MASSIDATKPTAGAALTADVRNNFSAAKTEIEALQATKLNLTGGTLSGWLKMAVGSGHYLYNLDTDASNYERLSIGWASNTLKINAEAAGTGTLRNLGLQTAGGYVGIGTASPTHGLHVSNGGDLSTMLVYNPDPGVYTQLAVRSARATGGGGTIDAPFVVMDIDGNIVSYIRQDGGVYSKWLGSADNATVAIGQENNVYGLALVNNGRIEWSGGPAWYKAKDLVLLREAANTLGQRNGLNAQTFRLYNTYTDASNYERGFLRWASNVLEIGAEAAGTGTARATAIYSLGGYLLTQSGSGVSTRARLWNADNTATIDLYPNRSGNAIATIESGQTVIGIGPGDGAYTHKFRSDGSMEFSEVTAPAAPATNGVRIYAEDNGAGKTRLMAHFATGAAVQVAIEP